MKILIIQTAFIGDVILATSMIDHLKKLMPDTEIDFLLRKGNEGLLSNNPSLRNILIWNKNHGKIKNLLKILLQVRKNRYDAVLNIQRFMNSGILTGLSGAKKRIGFHSNPLSFLFTDIIEHRIPHSIPEGFYHEVQRNLQLVRPLKEFLMPKDKDLKPKLYFSPSDKAKIESLPINKDYIVMAPSSVWYTKQWHFSKWEQLIEKLSNRYQIILIGAPSDRETNHSLSKRHSNSLNLAGELSLLQSALLMKGAARVFVNDSAPLHLASAVNAKTTAIFCSTVPDFGYYPLADDSIIIQRERLECMPCGLHGKAACPRVHFKCSMDIEVANTIQASNIENNPN